jgi:transcriptional regulator of heat shock response
MITEKEISKLSDKEKTEAILLLLSTQMKVRALKAQEKQLTDIVTHLENNSLITNIEDSKDKSWDRLKGFVDDLDMYVEKLDSIQAKLLNLENSEKIIEKATARSIVSFIKNDNGSN